MVIINDTSPITSLLVIEHIHLSPELYHRIIIPPGVSEELRRVESRSIEIEALLQSDWLEIHSLQDYALFETIFANLDKGESEAITLALELNADLLIIDETKGRNIAKGYGIAISGLLGVLIEAKKKGKITSVKTVLDRLISEAGFWVKADLYQLVLKSVGELN